MKRKPKSKKSHKPKMSSTQARWRRGCVEMFRYAREHISWARAMFRNGRYRDASTQIANAEMWTRNARCLMKILDKSTQGAA